MESQIQMYARLDDSCVCDGEQCFDTCPGCKELPDPELPCIWEVMNLGTA